MRVSFCTFLFIWLECWSGRDGFGWSGIFYIYMYRVYILLKSERKGFWIVLVVLEGAVRMLNPWGVGIKEGVAAY